MAPPNPKRPPRPPRPPGTQAPKDSDVELPFDDDEVDPLRADDPRPQRVPQFPAGARRGRRRSDGQADSADRELQAPRFDLSREYTDPGHPPAFLYVERGPGAGQLVPVKQGTLVLGRSSSADLRLQHPSISRRHAQLNRRGDRFFLKDLSSQNGTFLNKGRVTSEVELKPGDEISMGSALLKLRGPGGTPSLDMPAIITDTEVPFPSRRWKPGTYTAALIAAVVGSGVAALVSVLAIYLSDDEELLPAAPVEAGLKAPASPPPVEAAPAPVQGATTVVAAGATEEQASASGPAASTAEQAPTAPGAPGPEATPAAAGASGAAEAASSEAAPAGSEVPASGTSTGNEGPASGARTGNLTAGPSALDVARGAAKARSEIVSRAEADVLRRYVAGDVAKARDKARAAKLSALSAQLTRFAQAEAEARKAQAKGDVARATVQLTTAVAVDEALAPDGSRHGPALRKRLSGLLVQTGLGHVKAGREDAARETFEEALEYDAGNRQALEQLNRLRAAAAPSPAAPR